jgi:hypothetical protein
MALGDAVCKGEWRWRLEVDAGIGCWVKEKVNKDSQVKLFNIVSEMQAAERVKSRQLTVKQLVFKY